MSSWGSGRLDVFARGPAGNVYHRAWNGETWLDWRNVNGSIVGAPAATSWGPNRIDVLARGTTNSVYQRWWSP